MSSKPKIAESALPTMPQDVIPEPEAIAGMSEQIIIPPIENAPEKLDENLSENPPVMSPSGEIFDGNIHVSPDSINQKTGNFRRKKGAKNAQVSSNENGTDIISSNIGENFANLYISGGMFIFGADFAPSEKAEYEMLKGSFHNWAQANEITDISPNMALAMALIAYTGKKLATKPTCKQTFKERVILRLQKLAVWYKEKRANMTKDKMRASSEQGK